MKKIWPIVALGVVAYLAFALITLPASIITKRLVPMGVVMSGIQGTVWNGTAQVVQVAGANLGTASWDMRVLSLLSGTATADVDLSRADSFLRGRVSVGTKRIRLQNTSLSTPIGALPPQWAPGGWNGSINAKFDELTLVDNWPISATGVIEIFDLNGPARRPVNVGSYKVTFPAPVTPPGTLRGALNDIAGPVQITGFVEFKPDHSYLIEGLIATKPDAPPELTRALEFLGPPDAQGRRQLSVSGTI